MEEVVVSGVAFNRAEAKLELVGLPDKPGIAADVFGQLGDANVVVDMIIQDAGIAGRNDITFTVNVEDYDVAMAISKKIVEDLGGTEVTGNKSIAKVSAVGVGMRSHANVAARMFKALAEANINIQMISTSEIKISCVINAEDLDRAVQAIHGAFETEKKAAIV